MRIALLQMRSIAGQIQSNCEKIMRALDLAQVQKINLVCTPELALVGYPSEDLLAFQFILDQEKKALIKLQEHTLKTGVALLVGHTESAEGQWLYNTASLIEKGQILGRIRKERLPSYNIFHEARHFVPYKGQQELLHFQNLKIGVSICEDAWSNVDAYGNFHFKTHTSPHPVLDGPRSKCDLHINLSASPFEASKNEARINSFSALAKKLNKPFLWINRVGAQDAAIFDGKSAVYSPQLSFQAKAFEEDFLVWDSSQSPTTSTSFTFNYWEELKTSLILGIRDFVHQSGATKVVLGLSGGVDSACVAYLCAQALGPQNVHCISFPTKYTSELSKKIAFDLAQTLKVSFEEIAIQSNVDALAKTADVHEATLAFENLQSRVRGLLLMTHSNKNASLVMACGNKSEYATGYGTLYGDIAGALAPIGDLYKTQVYGLCHYINLQENIFSDELLNRAPTAELAPGQKDTDSLPHYCVLDTFLEELMNKQGASFVDKDWKSFLKTTTAQNLIDKVLGAEFKRYQAPPILRINNWAFGKSWQIPIARKNVP